MAGDTGMGFTDIGLNHMHERFGIPAPEAGEPTLKGVSEGSATPSNLRNGTGDAKPPDTTLTANKLMLNTNSEYTPEQQARGTDLNLSPRYGAGLQQGRVNERST
jgi:hypothetical protein